MTFVNWSAPELRLSKENIATWNAAMSHLETPIRLPDGDTDFHVTRQEGALPDIPFFKLLLDGQFLGYAGVREFPFDAYCGVDLEISEISDAPPELAGALAQGMLMTALAALPTDVVKRLRLCDTLENDTTLSEANRTEFQWFTCVVSGLCESSVEVCLGVSPEAACAEFIRHTIPLRQSQSTLADQIPMPVSRLLGSARLALSDLDELAHGDCILFSEAASGETCAVQAGQRTFLFDPLEDGWTCTRVFSQTGRAGAPHLRERVMDDTPNSPDEPANIQMTQPIASASLQVDVSFCLGSSSLPVSEIEGWHPGAVVSLPEEVHADGTLVTVSANGLPVAQGDLVRIDDRLAVRVNRLLVKTDRTRG